VLGRLSLSLSRSLSERRRALVGGLAFFGVVVVVVVRYSRCRFRVQGLAFSIQGTAFRV